MPQIKPYLSQVQASRPAEQAPQRTSPIGQGIENLGKGIGITDNGLAEGLYHQQAQKEIFNVSAQLSNLHLSAHEQLIELAKADPSQATPDKFEAIIKDYNEQSDKILHGGTDANTGQDYPGVTTASARDYFVKQNESYRYDFLNKLMVAQSEMAGEAILQGYQKTLNNISAHVYNSPGSYLVDKQAITRTVNDAVDLPATKRIELLKHAQTTMAVSAIKGMIDAGPSGPARAEAALKTGIYDEALGGPGLDQMRTAIDTGKREYHAEYWRNIFDQERLQSLKNKKILNDFDQKVLDGKTVPLDEIKKSGLDPKAQLSFMRMQSAMVSKNLDTDDPEVANQLKSLVFSGKLNDPSLLSIYRFGGGLSSKTYGILYKEMTGVGSLSPGEKEARGIFNRWAHNQINPMGFNPEAEIQFKSFQQDREQQQRAAGKSVADLYNPKNSDYLGTYASSFSRLPPSGAADQRSGQWVPPMTDPEAELQDIRSQLPVPIPRNETGVPIKPNLITPAAPKKIIPRNPGESMTDWLQRIKAASK